MLLQIDDKFRVTTDAAKLNFQLEKLTDIIDKKTREVVRQDWVLIGSHGNSFKSVLYQYSKEAVIEDDTMKTIADVKEKLNEINKTIERVVKKENIRMATKKDD